MIPRSVPHWFTFMPTMANEEPVYIKASVRLDPQKPRGLPRGVEGEVRSGWEFYLREGKKLHFITIEIGPDPVLTAVTEEQLRVWKDVEAVPMRRIFRDRMWREM